MSRASQTKPIKLYKLCIYLPKDTYKTGELDNKEGINTQKIKIGNVHNLKF